jgi:hypothetical protein
MQGLVLDPAHHTMWSTCTVCGIVHRASFALLTPRRCPMSACARAFVQACLRTSHASSVDLDRLRTGSRALVRRCIMRPPSVGVLSPCHADLVALRSPPAHAWQRCPLSSHTSSVPCVVSPCHADLVALLSSPRARMATVSPLVAQHPMLMSIDSRPDCSSHRRICDDDRGGPGLLCHC